MSNEREGLRERLEQIEAEMARSDPRFVSKEVREIVELGRKVLSLLTQAQEPPSGHDVGHVGWLRSIADRMPEEEGDALRCHADTVAFRDREWLMLRDHLGIPASERVDTWLETQAQEPVGYVVAYGEHSLYSDTVEDMKEAERLRREAEEYGSPNVRILPVGASPVASAPARLLKRAEEGMAWLIKQMRDYALDVDDPMPSKVRMELERAEQTWCDIRAALPSAPEEEREEGITCTRCGADAIYWRAPTEEQR